MAWAPSLRLLSTAARNSSQRRRVGIVGFGAVGKYLANAILKDPACQETLELAFVCEPVDPGAVVASGTVPKEAALDDLADFASNDAVMDNALADLCVGMGLLHPNERTISKVA